MRVPPLIITGMHRSGTSLTARLLQHCGLDLGNRLMAPRPDNPLGYYEDLAFGDLNRALVAAGIGDDPSCDPDWAYADRIVPSRLEPLRPRAGALVAEQGAGGAAWGFKDPRTSVLLDFYDELVPDARYVFVYRSPWDALSSLLRTHDGQIQGRADLAVTAWATYNARLLAFRERRPGRTVLVHVDAVAGRPGAVVELAQAQLDLIAPTTLDAGQASGAFVEGILQRTDARSALAELLAADHADVIELYGRLEAAADLASVQPRRNERPPAVAIEAAGGSLALSAVALVARADGVHDASHVARPAIGGAPALAADAGIDKLSGDLVAVVFDRSPRAGALATAMSALQDDPRLGAVLLAGGDVPAVPVEHDPLARVDAGAAIVLRRDAWLSIRGFAAVDPPAGFEAWAFAVGCRARGVRVARIAGVLDGACVARDEDHASSRVLERYPALAARRALHADARVRDAREAELAAREQVGEAEQRALEAERRADEARAERDRASGELELVRATRAWRVLTRWWRLRGRLPSRRKGR